MAVETEGGEGRRISEVLQTGFRDWFVGDSRCTQVWRENVFFSGALTQVKQ